MYLVKTPFWLKFFYKHLVWNKSKTEKILYLTFDDGPHETATPFVLEELRKFNAKASFFCIGKNVEIHQAIYQQIINEKHTIGNHTQNHVNGWQAATNIYLDEVKQAASKIDSKLFRPPYGRIKRQAIKELLKQDYTIVMWDVLSADFDTTIQPQQCLSNVINHAGNGSIIVFHDSKKAWKNLSYALPKVLEHFTKKGFVFKALQ